MVDEFKWAERAFDRQDEMHVELMRASLSDAKEAIRAAFLLNGAACIAIISFIAAGVNSMGQADPVLLAARHCLLWFAGGALLAAMTTGFAYLCNSLYAGSAAQAEKSFNHPFIRETSKSKALHRWALRLNWLAVVAVTGSYIAFAIGLITVGHAL